MIAAAQTHARFMMMVTRSVSPVKRTANTMAKSLRGSQYHQRKKQSKKTYSRAKFKQIENED